MVRGLRPTQWWMTTLVLAASCGPSLTPEETYVSRLAEARCGWARSCCEISELEAMLDLDANDPYSIEVARAAMASQEHCVDLVHGTWVVAQRGLLESVRRERAKLAPLKLDACVKLYDDAREQCTRGPANHALATACRPQALFEGQQPSGAPCYEAVDCAVGTTCRLIGPAGLPGVCQPTLEDGDPCSVDAQCPTGEACAIRRDATSPWCAASQRQGADQFCLLDTQCAEGLFCDTNTQLCSPLRLGGQSCHQDRQCASARCQQDPGVCEAPRAQTELCGAAARCEASAWCDPSVAGSVCAAPLTRGDLGQGCGDDASCRDGLRCIGLTCRAPRADGQACSDSAECLSTSYCDPFQGRCAGPRRAEGADCGESPQCAAGLYCPWSTLRCAPRVAAGQSCGNFSSSAPCIEGLRCDDATGRCEARLPAGVACRAPSDCAAGLVCEAFDGRCSARVATGADCLVSEACAADAYCQSHPGGSSCEKATFVGLGQRCVAPTILCEEGLTCSSGYCRARAPAGADCLAPDDCAEGTYCDTTIYPALCTTYASLGASCSSFGTLPRCAPGTTCAYDSGDGGTYHCATGRAVGGSCFSDDDCALGLVCPSSSCAAPIEEGGLCSSALECAPGLDCLTGHCQPRPGEGAVCTSLTDCAAGLYCRAHRGTCAPRGGARSSCGQGPEACAPGLECVGPAACQPKAQVDEPCLDGACADGLRCDDEWGRCVLLAVDLPLGASCHVSEECASGTCIAQQCTGFCQGVTR